MSDKNEYKVLVGYNTDKGAVPAGAVIQLTDKEAKPLLDNGTIQLNVKEPEAPAAPAPETTEPAAPTDPETKADKPVNTDAPAQTEPETEQKA